MQNVTQGRCLQGSKYLAMSGLLVYGKVMYMYYYTCRMMESADAIDDSDDEVDYSKMDQGNKKGPIGRWDFDTQEEYSDYMSNKEALPKYVLLLNIFEIDCSSHS